MFSLTYSAPYDPYNTVFRMLALFSSTDEPKTISFDTLRIADFYHCFPWLLNEFRAYAKITGFQKDKNQIVKIYPRSAYDILPDKHLVFYRMLPSQLAARAALLDAGSIALEEDQVRLTHKEPRTTKLRDALLEYREQHKALLSFLIVKLSDVPLFGPDGLKERSGLGEFRYDVL